MFKERFGVDFINLPDQSLPCLDVHGLARMQRSQPCRPSHLCSEWQAAYPLTSDERCWALYGDTMQTVWNTKAEIRLGVINTSAAWPFLAAYSCDCQKSKTHPDPERLECHFLRLRLRRLCKEYGLPFAGLVAQHFRCVNCCLRAQALLDTNSITELIAYNFPREIDF